MAVYLVGAGAAGMPATTLPSVQIGARREISRTNIEHSTPLSREQAFNAEPPSFPASVTWMLDLGC
jgi:hypothetical protein